MFRFFFRMSLRSPPNGKEEDGFFILTEELECTANRFTRPRNILPDLWVDQTSKTFLWPPNLSEVAVEQLVLNRAQPKPDWERYEYRKILFSHSKDYCRLYSPHSVV